MPVAPIVAVDKFGTYGVAPSGPYRRAAAIVPSDTDELVEVTNAIDVTVAGNINVQLVDDAAPAVLPISVGEHRWRVRKVMSTNTTATGIKALY